MIYDDVVKHCIFPAGIPCWDLDIFGDSIKSISLSNQTRSDRQSAQSPVDVPSADEIISLAKRLFFLSTIHLPNQFLA